MYFWYHFLHSPPGQRILSLTCLQRTAISQKPWWARKPSAVSCAVYRDLKHLRIPLERVFSHGGFLNLRLNSRWMRENCLLVFSGNSVVFSMSFPQVTVYKSGKPICFCPVLHTTTSGLMERRGCVKLAGAALRAKLCKNKALLISVHVINLSLCI